MSDKPHSATQYYFFLILFFKELLLDAILTILKIFIWMCCKNSSVISVLNLKNYLLNFPLISPVKTNFFDWFTLMKGRLYSERNGREWKSCICLFTPRRPELSWCETGHQELLPGLSQGCRVPRTWAIILCCFPQL